MINVDEIFNGFVLDHIQAGRSMAIYHYLNLDELDCQVAIIKNARSGKMGRKDIIKVEGPLDIVDFDILGFIDHNITVDIIKDGELVEKRELKLPKKIVNVLHCKNPRCIGIIIGFSLSDFLICPLCALIANSLALSFIFIFLPPYLIKFYKLPL